MESYPARVLSWDGRRRDSFSYKEPWTPPPWTLYVLLPPVDFFASTIVVRDESGSTNQVLTIASSEDRLFYFWLFGHARERHSFQVEARFERDLAAVQQRLGDVETIAGRRRWRDLRESVAGPLRASGAIIGAAAAIRALFGG